MLCIHGAARPPPQRRLYLLPLPPAAYERQNVMEVYERQNVPLLHSEAHAAGSGTIHAAAAGARACPGP